MPLFFVGTFVHLLVGKRVFLSQLESLLYDYLNLTNSLRLQGIIFNYYENSKK